MKALRKSVWLLIATMFFVTSCDERDYDAPRIDEPIFEYTGDITTIQALKDRYAGQALAEITEPIVIKGLVVANDVSGNLYQKIHLQDETGGIEIRILARSIFNDLRVGQEVFLECQGIYYGEYNGYPQLGYKGDNTLGLMPWGLFSEKCHRNGWAQPDLVVAKVVNSIEEITGDDVGKLITVRNVQFQDAGQPFAVSRADGSVQGAVQTESKMLVSATAPSSTLTARNSSASNFASRPMPSGIGSVTGVLSIFGTTYQITFRDYNDCSQDRFSNQGLGTQATPWTIEFALANQAANTSGWIQGYLVGAVAGGINEGNPIDGNEDIIFDAPFPPLTVVLAASADERDWTKCVAVNLPSGSDFDNQVNLLSNPANLGKQLKVKGTLQPYLGAAGLNVATGALSEFELEGVSASTIFLETFGTEAPTANPRPSIADYAGKYDNGAPVAFSGNTDVRATTQINSHIWFAAWSAQYPDLKYLTVSGINTAGAAGIRLSFDIAHNLQGGTVTTEILTVTAKDLNTSVSTQLTIPVTALGAQNAYTTIPNITGIPATSNLEIKFEGTQANTMGFRLDNVRIEGVR